MKKRKHPYGWYKRPCIIDIRPIPGLSNNNLRMHHIPTLRSHTSRRWIHKHWEVELKAWFDNRFKGGFTHEKETM